MPHYLVAIGISFAVSLLLFGILCGSAAAIWKMTVAHFKTERIERTCDTVNSFVAFLIPATLTLATWLREKFPVRWCIALLSVSGFWFLIVLFFTMYIRFNFVWRLKDEFLVGIDENLEIVYWLTTVMCGLTFGLLFLAIPIFVLGFGWNAPAAVPK